MSLVQKLQDSRELAAELQVQAQCHLEDKLQLKSVLSETQKHLVLNEKKMSELERILNEEKRIKIEKVVFVIKNLRQKEIKNFFLSQQVILKTVRT